MAESIAADERLANELYKPIPASGKPFTTVAMVALW
jgi:hypothetical protein